MTRIRIAAISALSALVCTTLAAADPAGAPSLNDVYATLATTKDGYSLESYLLGLNHYQIEMLANLDQVPEAGALIMVTWPKPEGGTGFPARAIAILP